MLNDNVEPQDRVRVSSSGAAILVEFDSPPVNALSTSMLHTLREALVELTSNRKPVILRGNGLHFCAGFDINAERSAAEDVDALARECVDAVQALPAPVIAAVEGAAVGLGLLLAASADLLVIAQDAKLGMPEVRLGVIGDVAPLRRHFPESWVVRMSMQGEIHSGSELGLELSGARLCESGTALLESQQLADDLAGVDPQVLAAVKARLRGS